MKKNILFLLFATMFCSVSAQTITLTFTGLDGADRYKKLDSIVIDNHSKGWQETIYYPDTVLTLEHGVGIDNGAVGTTSATSIQLFQNKPNPFNGITDVTLFVDDEGTVTMNIMDVNGRTIADKGQHAIYLQPGTHQFRIALSVAGTYVLTARQNGNSSSIKIMNNGGGNRNKIEYTGPVRTEHASNSKSPKLFSTKPFSYGDMMEYVGYATINDEISESEHITQTQSESEQFILHFADSQYVAPTVTTDSVVSVLAVTADIATTVISDGGTPIIVRGICWSDTNNPTISDSVTIDTIGVGAYTSTAVGLSTGTTYFVRAYATNSVGTSYGTELSFTTPDFPTVTTAAIGSITTTQVPAGGDVTSDGGAPVTSRGVCWSTSSTPTIADSITVDSSGIGTFTSVITVLSPNTTYYVRAYATNIAGTAYGNTVSIKTPKYPSIVTTAISNITATTAVSGGNVTNNGGVSMVARGVCWSTSPTPTIADSITVDGNSTGTFSSNLTGLTPATTYYVRAYATNTFGTDYGSEISFTTKLGGLPCTGLPTIKDYDNNTYNTVQVGSQCWMKESLRTTHYADGSTINEGSGTSSSVAYYYHANNSSSNDSIYGLLYNWKAVMRNSSTSSSNPSGVQGICPTGWHVPSDAEYTQLVNYMSSQNSYACSGTSTYIAKALASTTGWGTSVNTCAIGNGSYLNNDAGYSAYPAGYYYGSFGNFGSNIYLWTTTQSGSTNATGRYLRYSYADMRSAIYEKYYSFSVRCLKN